jgi:hypothetical protein
MSVGLCVAVCIPESTPRIEILVADAGLVQQLAPADQADDGTGGTMEAWMKVTCLLEKGGGHHCVATASATWCSAPRPLSAPCFISTQREPSFSWRCRPVPGCGAAVAGARCFVRILLGVGPVAGMRWVMPVQWPAVHSVLRSLPCTRSGRSQCSSGRPPLPRPWSAQLRPSTSPSRSLQASY